MSYMKIIQFCLCLAMVCMAGPVHGAGPDEAVGVLEQSVGRAATAGRVAEKWQTDRERIIQEVLDLELKDAWTRFQLEKTHRYIESEQQNMAGLKKNMAQAAEVRDTLEPFLEILYLDLETQVKNDLPFALEERHRRLDFIRSYLDNPAASLADKFGRILEAMQVESEYGYSVDVTREIIREEGQDPSEVTLFRLGRLGLFRVFAKNARVLRYQKESGTWQDIAPATAGALNKAVEIARKKRVSTVVKLPLGNSSRDMHAGGGI